MAEKLNKKKLFLWVLLLVIPSVVFAQKASIDTGVFGKWPQAYNPTISNNGAYVSYIIGNEPYYRSQTLIIQGITDHWKKTYEGADQSYFSGDSHTAYFQKKDTLFIISLGTEEVKKIPVRARLKIPDTENKEWVAYEPKSVNQELVVLNLINGKAQRFGLVKNYVWDDHGKVLLLSVRKNYKSALQWLDLNSETALEIWSAEDTTSNSLDINTCKFNQIGSELSFVIKTKADNHTANSIWYYREGTEKAVKLADDQSQGIKPGMSIVNVPDFSENGRWLFLELQAPPEQRNKPKPGLAQVDVYSYKDYLLQSQQLEDINAKHFYMAVVPVSGGPVIQLEQAIDGVSTVMTRPPLVPGDYIVLGEKYFRDFKPWWLTEGDNGRYSLLSYYLVSLKDGTRALLKDGSLHSDWQFSFSPGGRWLVYWDSGQAGYVSYDIFKHKSVLTTRRIPGIAAQTDYINMFEDTKYVQPADADVRWFSDDSAFLVYDSYDLWKVYLGGNTPPVNLTQGYGANHHTRLRLIYQYDGFYQPLTYSGKDTVMLAGFKDENKYNGFYKLSLSGPNTPRLLTMGPYCYYRAGSQIPQPSDSFSNGLLPVKAKDADAWIISRETASEHPNFFYTKDWKHFTPLTNLQPQKNYNWISSELINYKQLDGTPSQGILYKPENFNLKKKYPVIFNYYEQLSYRLYEFPAPELTAHNINIPWFVSRGYLVFTPDIHYKMADTKNGKTVGESAYNSIESAAIYLSKLPYIDSKHLGIQGHSFGGGETNYLVTHTNLFAAACSFAGTVSDQVSAYLGPFRNKGNAISSYRIAHSENGHEMIGATLWERPDLYFRSSSVFNADRVTTPLLLVHNEADEQTDWGQSFELFTALWRLGKPVWMLQYDGEGHTLNKEEDARDFTIRLTQFFDHYLKGAPASVWMTKGVPAKLKGIDAGLAIDSTDIKPNKLCIKTQKQL
jgi:dienelactone hydrolase